MEVKIGNVVLLKSGSPRMNVIYRSHYKDDQFVVGCEWLDDRQNYRKEEFLESSLKVVKEEPD